MTMKQLLWLGTAGLLAAVCLSGCTPDKMQQEQSGQEQTEASPLTVTFLDVGKGDCILLEQGGCAAMIDTGYEATSDDVLALLAEHGVEQLDALIITHYDKDHVGGASNLVQSVPTEQIYLPDYEGDSNYYTAFMDVIERASYSAQRVDADISFTLGDVDYQIFSSAVDYENKDGEEGNDNDCSLVIAARFGEDSYLFAGDIEKKGIKKYLAAEHGQFDVVKMPHHGRKESNTDDFIEQVQPQIAVITDSTDDAADQKTLKLLKESNTEIYQISEYGTVTVTGSGTGVYTVA